MIFCRRGDPSVSSQIDFLNAPLTHARQETFEWGSIVAGTWYQYQGTMCTQWYIRKRPFPLCRAGKSKVLPIIF